MAVSAEQIKQAYKIVFGGEPAANEIKDIQGNPQFWGKSLDTLVDRLTSTQRFASQPVNETTIENLFMTYLGSKPTPNEMQEILKNKQFWGATAGVLKTRLTETARYQASPGVKLTQSIKGEDLNRDLQKIGLSQDIINGMSDEQKTFYGGIGLQLIDNIEKSIPAPTTFTAGTLKELYEQAKNNQKINDYYSRLESRQIEQITTAVATMQEDFDYLQQQQAEGFTKQVEGLAKQTQQAGMLSSGLRKRNEQMLEEKQLGVIKSSRADVQRQLTQLQRGTEEALGTKALEDLQLAIQARNNFGEFVNPRVAQMMGGTIRGTASSTPIQASESALGQQKQAEIQAEYERLKSERDLLTNPMNT